MNSEKYIEILGNIIRSQLPEDEYNNAIQYYTEYFADAGEEKVDDVIKELGSPETLAKKIIFEYRGKVEENSSNSHQKKSLSVGWWIFIAVVGSPIWMTIFCTIISFVMCLFAILVSIGAFALAGVISAAALTLGGIALIFTAPATGILVLGMGLLIGAFGCIFTMLIVFLVNVSIKYLRLLIIKLKNRRTAA